MNEANNKSETEHGHMGPLYESGHATAMERADRENPIPGGEPPCPVCGAKTTRLVEEHQSPHMGSPFRVRIICSNAECRRWTVFNW